MDKKKILYINHSDALGGSIRSLAYQIGALDKEKYDPIVICSGKNSEVVAAFEEFGAKVFIDDHIHVFSHTTGTWYSFLSILGFWEFLKAVVYFLPSIKQTVKIVRQINPDLVHLNSLVLPASAIGAKISGLPVVWHVRESVVTGHFGLRKGILRWLILKFADEIVFISSDNKRNLVGYSGKGELVPDFVDLARFDYHKDGAQIRNELLLERKEKVILFMGGRSTIKGIFPLLKALPIVKEMIPDLHCIIAGGAYTPSNRLISRIARKILPLVGYGTINQRVDKLFSKYCMESYVYMLPWREDIESLIAASDLVVFPSIEPHFARPVIEAGAMSKPVVASNIGGVEELVEDGITGLLVPPGDVSSLADALVEVLGNGKKALEMGREGLRRAKSLYSSANIELIEDIYERLL